MQKDKNTVGMDRRTFMSSTAAIGAGLFFASESFAFGRKKCTKLRYREDGTFKIVQFTDTHFHNNEPEDFETLKLMGGILDIEKPDIVIFTGDNISGNGCKDSRDMIRTYAKPIVERKLNWAAVFGNHDDEGGVSKEEQMKVLMSLDGFLGEAGHKDVDGVGNYYLHVYDKDGKKAENTLYFIDSLAYAEKRIGGYAWITRNQVNWYVESAKKIAKENKRKLPALAFYHIPLCEYNEVVKDPKNFCGYKQERVCCAKINSGFYAAMLEAGDIMATFVGHDHVSDYEGDHFGIKLCYGRATGYNAYGKEGFPRGARVIELKQGKREYDTWMRVAGGKKICYRGKAGVIDESDK